ncbi:gamma-glutamyl-gamma-aminobutyrate hydrolase family protein [Paenibacillus sp. IHBB 10380]|uniref:gamma-glutamyl-gamma-aminobutyrate hydrolase family protein n=1 Tax=Paenibacillus sp. IHBB 10380 TaxID=1566358 RepID=UPI0005CFB620|nr:gamma-glutamyl-gamma-aminobutyrate hydrolase family protein [Paenibacillus sp. IHBB 10380]AJS57200.1 hypothetical protein UB51_00300 [Paenibacillus sp. IHBB 10380]
MKKLICISQREDYILDYQERRDALDQRWALFLKEVGGIPLPLPNVPNVVQDILSAVKPDGILLTGGNTSLVNGGDPSERDIVDSLLISYAINNSIPIIGVCLGMQSLVIYFGGTLKPIDEHVSSRHMVNGIINREVNSYHKLAVDTMPSELIALAKTEGGVVECIGHQYLPILGIMWHPERENQFNPKDLLLFKNFWHGQIYKNTPY